MNEITVDREFEQQAVESQLSRLALVHGCTGTLGWRTCTLFTPTYEASEDDEAAVRCGRIDLTEKPVEPQQS